MLYFILSFLFGPALVRAARVLPGTDYFVFQLVAVAGEASESRPVQTGLHDMFGLVQLPFFLQVITGAT